MADKYINDIVMSNAELIMPFRNFQGKETDYNPAGRRNFCVFIPEDIEEQLKADGWNVKHTRPRDPDEAPRPYLQVAVSYENYPPKVYTLAGNRKTLLDDKSIGELDHAEIESVDLIIRPYQWSTHTGSGVKAYLKTMYVTIKPDPFAGKYDRYEEDVDQDIPF